MDTQICVKETPMVFLKPPFPYPRSPKTKLDSFMTKLHSVWYPRKFHQVQAYFFQKQCFQKSEYRNYLIKSRPLIQVDLY